MEQMTGWRARWICLDNEYFPQLWEEAGLPPVVFRRNFTVRAGLERATLYATALGVYEAQLGGRVVGDERLAPGWTDYNKRILYQTYDATPYLTEGENELLITVADGWYVGHISITGRNQYGRYPLKALAQLELCYADGTREVVATDADWQAGTGEILYSDMQTGEGVDARLAQTTQWYGVRECGADVSRLVPQEGPGLKVMELRAPAAVYARGDSVMVDMGQNMAGIAAIRWRGKAGQKAVVRHGEMLCDDGSLYTENLRTAKQTDSYIFCGDAEETFEPRFTMHGFRYMEITGVPLADVLEVTGKVIYTDVARRGSFSCSNDKVNRLYENIVWGQKGNFSTVPTDCPQRDERLGWTGDAQIFAKTACYNMDCSSYFRKYVTDVMDAQLANGAFTDIAPYVRKPNGAGLVGYGSAAWGDAGIIIPWTLYEFYGDTHTMQQYWPNMQRHMDYLLATSEGYIRDDHGYGDWLSVGEETPRPVMATAYMAYCASLLAKIAGVLGREDDQKHYETLFADIARAFEAAFWKDGRIEGDTQTCYVLALKFGLLSESNRATAAARLAQKVEQNGNRLTTGFVGVSYLLPVLCDWGYDNIAARLLLQEEYPSWLYSVNNGATTVWERWNSYTRESGFGDVGMNSFNHYSLGSVGEWMMGYVGGIRQQLGTTCFAQPLVRPVFAEGLDWVRARYETGRGAIAVSWQRTQGDVAVDVELPCPGRVELPDGTACDVPAGIHHFTVHA